MEQVTQIVFYRTEGDRCVVKIGHQGRVVTGHEYDEPADALKAAVAEFPGLAEQYDLFRHAEGVV